MLLGSLRNTHTHAFNWSFLPWLLTNPGLISQSCNISILLVWWRSLEQINLILLIWMTFVTKTLLFEQSGRKIARRIESLFHLHICTDFLDWSWRVIVCFILKIFLIGDGSFLDLFVHLMVDQHFTQHFSLRLEHLSDYSSFSKFGYQ